MTKRHRDMVAEIETLGYAYDRTNSKGAHFYVHEDTGREIRVTHGTTEHAVRETLRIARQLIGLPTKDNKRNPAAIRERNAAEHARAAKELARIRAERDALTMPTEAEIRRAEEAYLRAERRFRYWDRLMREAVSA